MNYKTVWKYELSLGDNEIEVPEGASPVRVGYQDSTLCLWCVVLPNAPKVKKIISVYGTGHPVPLKASYIGSVQNGPFEWHVFEVSTRQVS